MSEKPVIIPFSAFTRGAFTSVAEASAGGYRWTDQLYVAYFGREFLLNLNRLTIENIHRVDLKPYNYPITDSTGFRRHPISITGPWLTNSPTGLGEWDGDLVYNRPALEPPRNEPEIHRRFARLSTPRLILRFANRYGLLGSGYTCKARLTDEPLPLLLSDAKGWLQAEHLAHWEAEIWELAMLVQLWDWVTQQREDRLRIFVRWSESPPRGVLLHWPYIRRPPWNRFLPYKGEQDERGASFETVPRSWIHGDVLMPARSIVAYTLNRRLEGHVHPVVYPGRSELYFEPDSLLAALYVSFALEVTGKQRARQMCAREGCGEYFLVKHKRQKYCDENCRKRDHEQRKKQSPM